MKHRYQFLLFMFLMYAEINPAFAQWVQTGAPDSLNVYSLSVSGTYNHWNLVAGTDSGVYVSIDTGTTWSQEAVTDGYHHPVLSTTNDFTSNYVYAGNSEGELYFSSDYGSSWQQIQSHFINPPDSDVGVIIIPAFQALLLSDSDLYAGTNIGVYVSHDSGANFHYTSPGGAGIRALAICNGNLFAGAGGTLTNEPGDFWGGIYMSTDNGMSWNYDLDYLPSLENKHITSFAVMGNNVLAGTDSDGVYVSSDNGMTWTSVNTGLTNNRVWSLYSTWWYSGDTVASLLFAGTENGVFQFTNSGSTNWLPFNTGLTNTKILSLAGDDTDLFAGTEGHGIWKRSLYQIITGLNHGQNQAPSRFALEQNYPNPFNPSTTINYQLPMSSQVTLKIYDVLGREMITLVNGRENAGAHAVSFDGSRLPSGVYFYRLRAGIFDETKKLLLLK